ncbi:MAG: hypothetical protein K9M75_12825 [Phycisphaerae bacterium]|nr:hypothetical protein [Phycisphaerae bacterium]
MKNAAIFILLSVLIVLSGCVSGPKFSFQIRRVTIETIPSGAKVYQINSIDKNEIFLGTTPIREQPVRVLTEVRGKLSSTAIDWMTSQIQMLNIRIEKTGYVNYEGNLATDPGKTIVHKLSLDPKRY